MYARQVDDRELTLGVSGKLWRHSLIMYDKETQSEWSHILGQAMAGPLKGTLLQQIPSTMTDWYTFQNQYPKGTVLWMTRSADGFRREMYRDTGKFVLGIVSGDKSWAWSFGWMLENPVSNHTLGDQPAVVTFDDASMTARVFDRSVDVDGEKKVLTFSATDQRMQDDITGSHWEPTTGRAVEGALQGTVLESLPGFLSFSGTWRQFHPESETMQVE